MNLDIITRRLSAQGLAAPRFETPAEVVGWLGAVQSQDYPGAKWALAQRMAPASGRLAGISDDALDRAFNAGEILRTHVMRPTWHFVRPEDIRWMIALTGPRLLKSLAGTYRRFGLEEDELRRAAKVIEKALRGGNALTRAELVDVLDKAGFDVADNLRAMHLILRPEIDGLIISGPKSGKQHTFALLDERAPQTAPLAREESLAELAWRFFRSHGPATIKDFAWWSALTTADAKLGIAASGARLVEEVIDGLSYWSGGESTVRPASRALLLPNYDEYVVAYVDRRPIIEDAALHALDPRGNLLFSHTVLVDGRVVGTWKRTFKKGAVVVEMKLLKPPDAQQAAAIDAALARYGEFLGMRVEVAEG